MTDFIRTLLLIGGVFFTIYTSHSQEICDNAVDDDGDGLVDLNDSDCDCNNLIELSLIPNPSFEDTLCCPETEAMLVCSEDWFQASDATSDYYNYCGVSELLLDGAFPPETPLPGGGEGFIGLYNFLSTYREYVGVCLDAPLVTGVSYALKFHTAYAYGDEDELLLELYGTPNCVDLPWAGVTCPSGIGSWILLGVENVTYVMDGSWQEVTITFTPIVDISAIAFGGPCGDIGATDGSYFYFDELILNESIILGEIITTGGWCSEDILLTAVNDELDGTWQWYKDGIALLGETSETLSPLPYGEGVFTAVFSYLDGCKSIDYESPSIPVSDFEFENVCYGETVSFINLSEEAGYSGWTWNFGDGTFSNLIEPTHDYEDPGTYVVDLIIYSEDPSCNDTATAELNVFPKPEADFSVEGIGVSFAGGDWIVCANHELDFVDLTTIDGAPSFSSWLWDFGDGVTSDLSNPTHTYLINGTYNAKFVIKSEAGCLDSVNYDIVVNELVADFSFNDACVNEEVLFNELSYSSDGFPVVSWVWNFGDDSELTTEQNPTYVYDESGYYDVGLIATNLQGCLDTAQKIIQIYNNPEPDFYVDRSETDYFNTDFRFSISYPSADSDYLWIMPEGDPNSSTSSDFVDVRFPEFVIGNYEVVLIETNVHGCIDSNDLTVFVLEDELVIAPNAFTPNNDPMNPDWGVYVTGFQLEEFYLYVFNRWGEIVWQTRDPNNRWDGTGPDGIVVKDDVYTWYIKARDQINDEVFEYNGFIMVFK